MSLLSIGVGNGVGGHARARATRGHATRSYATRDHATAGKVGWWFKRRKPSTYLLDR